MKRRLPLIALIVVSVAWALLLVGVHRVAYVEGYAHGWEEGYAHGWEDYRKYGEVRQEP